MSRNRFEEHARMKALFAVEREVHPEPDDLRQRVIDRARATLAHQVRLRHYRAMPSRRLRTGTVAAAAVVLVGFCAAAFQAGYRFKTRNATVALTNSPAMVPTIVAPLVPEESAASATAPSSPESEASPTALRPTKSRPARVPTSSEAYVAELAVLQPALDAVAKHDFAAALVPITIHQKRFSSGQLAEEREGLRVKALVGLGRMPEAAHVASAFRERFPHSALLGQVEELIGTLK